MQIAMIGLGRMGGNMVRRLLRGGHEVVVWNRDYSKCEELAKVGAIPAKNVEDLAKLLKKPRAAWVMLPSGDITEQMVAKLNELFESGDVVIDGGNSYYKDDARRSQMLGQEGDPLPRLRHERRRVGRRARLLPDGRRTEGRVRAHRAGVQDASSRRRRRRATPGRKGGNAENGFLHCGPSGAGHFVKMIHNGIEYGIMQAYAEGFDILKNANGAAPSKDVVYDMKLEDIAELWRRGSVVGSWLLDLTAMALQEDPKLARYTGFVQDSGEGRWTVLAAVETATPAEVLTSSLYTRFRSRQEHTYAEKMISAMREKFGGHVETTTKGG
jgi:6-phosphogluconate dehydrogenase